MNRLLLLSFFIIYFSSLFSQNETILIISDENAQVFIDGDLIGKIQKEIPSKFKTNAGDHFIMLKSDSLSIDKSQKVVIESGKQKMVEFKFATSNNSSARNSSVTGTVANKNPENSIKIAELSMKIDGNVDVSLWLADQKDASQNYPNFPKYYYGFLEGDYVVLNFNTMNKNGTQKVVVSDYFTKQTVYQNFNFQTLENTKFKIPKKSIYVFEFSTNHAFSRDCKCIISKIPANDISKNYNSEVEWVDVQDTTFKIITKDAIVRYDSSYVNKKVKNIIKRDTSEVMFMNKNETIEAWKAGFGINTNNVTIILPKNETIGTKETKLINWAYWIGVNESGNQAWNQNKSKFSSIVKTGASFYTTPLGALCVGAITDLYISSIGDDYTDYKLTLNSKYIDYGKGSASYKKFSEPNQGTLYLSLTNENKLQPIKVNVIAVAIVETSTFEEKEVRELVLKPVLAKKEVKEPVNISIKKIPVSKQ